MERGLSDSNGLSSAAFQRRQERQQREQLDSLEKLLETSDQRLVESNRTIARLTQDLEAANRSNKQYEKKCTELYRENQRLRTQLESTVRVTNPHPHRVVSQNDRPTVSQGLASRNSGALADELQRARAALERTQQELDLSRQAENELAIKVKILGEALEFRVDEIGLSGHADLLAKVAAMRGEVAALRSELGM